MEIYFMSGMSGSGKTTISNIFEDLDFFVIDNLPPKLIKPLINLLANSKRRIKKLLVVFDIRGGEFLNDFLVEYRALDKTFDKRLIFIDAKDDVLVKRFQETRRGHPIYGRNLISSIKKEREKLESIRKISDDIIDTSNATAKSLINVINAKFSTVKSKNNTFTFNIFSFGYKFGNPIYADYIYDTRFIENPFYEEKLRNLSGKDIKVRNFVFKDKISKKFLKSIVDQIMLVKNNFISEGKNSLSIGFGCTGGRHRSVSFAIELSKILKEKKFKVILSHRDI